MIHQSDRHGGSTCRRQAFATAIIIELGWENAGEAIAPSKKACYRKLTVDPELGWSRGEKVNGLNLRGDPPRKKTSAPFPAQFVNIRIRVPSVGKDPGGRSCATFSAYRSFGSG